MLSVREIVWLKWLGKLSKEPGTIGGHILKPSLGLRSPENIALIHVIPFLTPIYVTAHTQGITSLMDNIKV